jgi:hypothetical protein
VAVVLRDNRLMIVRLLIPDAQLQTTASFKNIIIKLRKSQLQVAENVGSCCTLSNGGMGWEPIRDGNLFGNGAADPQRIILAAGAEYNIHWLQQGVYAYSYISFGSSIFRLHRRSVSRQQKRSSGPPTFTPPSSGTFQQDNNRK